MAFEYLGRYSKLAYSGGNEYDFDFAAERAYTLQCKLDDFVGLQLRIDIEVNFATAPTYEWRIVWTSGELNPAAAAGYGEVPGLTIPPFAVARQARMAIWLLTGDNHFLDWDLFGL